MRTAIIFALLCLSAFATDIYFAPTSAGSNNGTSCGNAYAYSDATHGWSQSAQQSAGNNLHVCSGTYTLSAGGSFLNSVNSGTSGSPITWIADQGAVTVQAPYISGSGGATIGNAWWVLNGDNNLTIQNTLNGTSGGSCIGGSCSDQQASIFIELTCSTCNDVVENMSLVDNYVHSSTGDNFGQAQSVGVYFLGSSNVTISGITCHDAWACLNGWGSNVLVYSNTFYNVATAWWFGPNVPTSSLIIHDNLCYDTGVWYTTADTFHLECFHIFPNSGTGNVSGLQFYNNFMGPQTNSSGAQTADLFTEGPFTSPEIFNNVCYNLSTDFMPCFEFSTSTGGSFTWTNGLIVNNTTLQGSYSQGGNESYIMDAGLTSVTFENNVVTAGIGLVDQPGSFASGGLNYNAYDSGTSSPFAYQGVNKSSLSAWQTATGQDANAIYDSISTLKISTTTGLLSSGSPIIGLGTNLTSLGITALETGAPQTFGAGGSCGSGCLARPSSGAWDAGAYPYSSAGPTPTPAPALGMFAWDWGGDVSEFGR